MALKLFSKLRPWRRRRPSVEIHVPISPTENFFTMVRYLAASIQLNGGGLAASPIIVTVGADQEPEDLHARLPWSRSYPIEWRWLDRELFRRHDYFGTAVERFCYSYNCDVVLLLDADVFVVAPIDDLVSETARSRRFSGFVAHGSPFWLEKSQPGDAWWEQLFREAGLGPPPFVCQHTAWGALTYGARQYDEVWTRAITDPRARYCPPYFNLGFLMAPADVMNCIGSTIYQEMAQVDRVLQTIYRRQLAVSMALQRLRLPWQAVGARYNFANRSELEVLFPDELADVRIIHYLLAAEIDKAQIFRSVGSVKEPLRRQDLKGSNRILQTKLEHVHKHIARHDRSIPA